MKKLFLAVAVVIAVASGIVFHDTANDNSGLVYCERQDAIVTDVTKQRVTVKRVDGHVFTFVGNGYNVGDIVSLTVDTKNTYNDVSDDAVWHVAKQANL